MSTSTWSDLMHACHSCQRCALCDRPTTTFFGVGAHDAQVLVIGDCGQSLIGGHNGTQLAQLMELIGLSRNNTYITAVVKCKNHELRPPLHTEYEACLPLLRQQVALLKPRIILCLGASTAQWLIDERIALDHSHGVWIERNGIHMTALHAPADLVCDTALMPVAFSDWKGVEEKIRSICPEIFEKF